jgi:hypothetical protein
MHDGGIYQLKGCLIDRYNILFQVRTQRKAKAMQKKAVPVFTQHTR